MAENSNNARFTPAASPAANRQEVSMTGSVLGSYEGRANDVNTREFLMFGQEPEAPETPVAPIEKPVVEKPKLLAGTFKDEIALEKAYKELQSAFTKKSQVASQATKLQTELTQISQAYQQLQQQIKPQACPGYHQRIRNP